MSIWESYFERPRVVGMCRVCFCCGVSFCALPLLCSAWVRKVNALPAYPRRPVQAAPGHLSDGGYNTSQGSSTPRKGYRTECSREFGDANLRFSPSL